MGLSRRDVSYFVVVAFHHESAGGDRVADRIKLHRQVDSRPAVVVEGKSDQRFVARVLSADQLVTFIAGTRAAVLQAAADVASLRLTSVACVVDRDFDDLVAVAESDGLPIVPYDNADLESMLWSTAAMDALIEELGSGDKLSAAGGAAALRSAVGEVLRPVSRLRRANAVNGWGLNFDDGLRLQRRVNLTTLRVRRQSLCDGLWRDDLGIDKAFLYAVAEEGADPLCPATGERLIRGKDALEVTGVALRRLFGNLKRAEASGTHLAECLRLCSSEIAVERTRWREGLRNRLGL